MSIIFDGTSGQIIQTGTQTFSAPVAANSTVTINSGTANGVPYLNTSKVLTTGNVLVFDGTNLGIGPPTPEYKLDVSGAVGDIAAFRQAIVVTKFGTTNLGQGEVYQDAYPVASPSLKSAFIWRQGSSESMRLDMSGNLGIGTSSPSAKLDVTGNTAISGTVTLSGGTANGVSYLNGSKVLTTGSALTFDGTTFTSGAHTLSTGNLNFGTTGQRITGDFSNATAASRVMLQSSTTNGNTIVGAIPNGTGTNADFRSFNNSDTTNAAFFQLGIANSGAEARLNSSITGTGTYLPMTFVTGGSERVRIDTLGNVGIGTSSPTYRLDVFTPNTNDFAGARIRNNDAGSSAYAGLILNANGNTWAMRMGSSAANSNALQIVVDQLGTPTVRATLDTSGDLGLGVTPSAWGGGWTAVQIGRSALFTRSDNAGTHLGWNMYVDGTPSARYIATAQATQYRQYLGEHAWFTAASGTAGDAITFTQAMTLNSSGNLGIGTTSPIARLHIDRDGPRTLALSPANRTAGGASYILMGNNDSGGTAGPNMIVAANRELSFGTGSSFNSDTGGTFTELMRISSNGNVGVGTTSPGTRLELSKVYVGAGPTWAGGDDLLKLTAASGSAWAEPAIAFHEIGSNIGAKIGVKNTGNGAMNIIFANRDGSSLTSTMTERARIDVNGNLLLGTTTALGRLSVGLTPTTNSITDLANFPTNSRVVLGDAAGTSTTDSKFFLGAGFSGGGNGINTGFGFIRESTNNWGTALAVYTHSTATSNEDELIERARFNSAGDMMVGITSAPIVATRGLYVAGLISPNGNYSPNGNIGGQITFAGSPGTPVCGRVFMGDNTGWQWEWGPYGAGGWVRRFFFTDGGAAYSSTGTWGTISDARLKENIVDATPKLAELMQLNVRNFNFITEPGNKQLGFVAQEVEEIFPGLVDNTKPDEDGNSTKAVKTTVLIPMLVKAIQEQQDIITNLSARIVALESK